MDSVTLMLFIPACFALNMVPGPNNLLAMSNGQRFGLAYAVSAGFGRLTAFVVMIFLAATGLAAILYTSETLFLSIKIVGSLYLFWIAYQLWISDAPEVVEQKTAKKTLLQLVQQEFFLAVGNPKAILIFTAFFPQFVNTSSSTGSQFLILGIIFLCLELLALSTYASFGVYLRQWFSKPNMRKLFNRSCAGVISIMGIGLLVDRKG